MTFPIYLKKRYQKSKGLYSANHRYTILLAVCECALLLLVGCPQSQKSTEDLLVDLESSDSDTRLGAAFILGNREPEVVPPLISALQKEKEGKVRYWLIWSLKNIGTTESTNAVQLEIPLLEKEYAQQDEERKKMASLTLQMIGNQEALAIIGNDKIE